jgi:hypothetical protein
MVSVHYFEYPSHSSTEAHLDGLMSGRRERAPNTYPVRNGYEQYSPECEAQVTQKPVNSVMSFYLASNPSVFLYLDLDSYIALCC